MNNNIDINYYGIKKSLKKMSPKSYLKFHKLNNYINYCELLILEDGKIILAQPSHIAALSGVIKENCGLDLKELSINYYVEDTLYYSKCILVRQNRQEVFSKNNLTDQQIETFDFLVKFKLIESNLIGYSEEFIEFFLNLKKDND